MRNVISPRHLHHQYSSRSELRRFNPEFFWSHPFFVHSPPLIRLGCLHVGFSFWCAACCVVVLTWFDFLPLCPYFRSFAPSFRVFAATSLLSLLHSFVT